MRCISERERVRQRRRRKQSRDGNMGTFRPEAAAQASGNERRVPKLLGWVEPFGTPSQMRIRGIIQESIDFFSSSSRVSTSTRSRDPPIPYDVAREDAMRRSLLSLLVLT